MFADEMASISSGSTGSSAWAAAASAAVLTTSTGFAASAALLAVCTPETGVGIGNRGVPFAGADFSSAASLSSAIGFAGGLSTTGGVCFATIGGVCFATTGGVCFATIGGVLSDGSGVGTVATPAGGVFTVGDPAPGVGGRAMVGIEGTTAGAATGADFATPIGPRATPRPSAGVGCTPRLVWLAGRVGAARTVVLPSSGGVGRITVLSLLLGCTRARGCTVTGGCASCSAGCSSVSMSAPGGTGGSIEAMSMCGRVGASFAEDD